MRSQLSYMYDYIMVCKQKEELLKLFGDRVYFMTGTEMMSLRDFQEVGFRMGEHVDQGKQSSSLAGEGCGYYLQPYHKGVYCRIKVG